MYDARVINDYFRSEKFTLPSAHDPVFASGARYFTSLDLESAFYQVPLRRGLRKFFGLHVNGQTYHWKVMPFGFVGSPHFFDQFIGPLVEKIS